MRRPISRRTRRVLYTFGGSATFVALAVAGILVARRDDKPYRPGEDVAGITDSLGRTLPDDVARVRFTDVAAEAGLTAPHFDGPRSSQLPEDMGPGAAWGDFDGDGWDDLYVPNFAGALSRSVAERAVSTATGHLYRNQGDGTFADVTARAGLATPDLGLGAAWADIDGDGDLDLSVTRFGTNALYRNDGDGTFRDIGAAGGFAGPEGFWTGVSWADYDRDGALDAYVCGYVQYVVDPAGAGRTEAQYGALTPVSLNPSSFEPERNLLYHNNGDGTFAEVAAAAGVDNPTGRSLSATWSDLDDDGWLDLYVANDVSDNALYRNNGDGTFADISHEAWVSDPRGAMGLATGDWDNDLDQDVFVTHWIAQENALYVNLRGNLPAPPAADAAPADVAVADSTAGTADVAAPATAPAAPPMRFTDMADQYGVGQIALDFVGWGTAFLDYDRDGRLDLFVANGHTFQDEADPTQLVAMANQLFWNRGPDGEGFFDVGAASGDAWAETHVARGAAVADYDHDGDPDIVVANHGAPPTLLRNDGGREGRDEPADRTDPADPAASRNHWLSIRLAGRRNRFGIGAKVIVTTGDRRQVREVGVGSSYLSQHAPEAQFGLGAAGGSSTVEVRWPGGEVQAWAEVAADQRIELTEGRPEVRRLDAGGNAVVGVDGVTAGTAYDRGPTSVDSGTAIASGESVPQLAGGTPVHFGPSDPQARVRFWELQRAAVAAMKGENDCAKASALFREALALDPLHEDALFGLGGCLSELGDYAAALEPFEALVALNPQSLRGHLQIGAIHASPDAGDLFDLAVAERAYATAVAINPEESGALMQLGATALAAGDIAAAEQALRQAGRLNEQAVIVHYLLGYIAWRVGDAEAAGSALRKAVDLSHDRQPTQPAPAEGDTGRPGQRAHEVEAVKRRRLFGAELAALATRPVGEALSAADVASEYETLDRTIADLGR
ncbi:MAG: VCBS repeat-containing protein [Ardenticatenales bacterium]|nr:VCBS repeat-containing protein [Ardenticatenales bacterium]